MELSGSSYHTQCATELHSCPILSRFYQTINAHKAPASCLSPLLWYDNTFCAALALPPGSRLIPVTAGRLSFKGRYQFYALGTPQSPQCSSHFLLCHFETHHQMPVALKLAFSQCQCRHRPLRVLFLIHILHHTEGKNTIGLLFPGEQMGECSVMGQVPVPTVGGSR